jgi:hypothetical protein
VVGDPLSSSFPAIWWTCLSDHSSSPLGAYALDITTPSTLKPTPEPGRFVLFGGGLILMGFLIRKRRMLQPHAEKRMIETTTIKKENQDETTC